MLITHDAWFLLESIAEKLTTLNSIPLKHARFSEETLSQGWQWDEVIKAHYDREDLSTLTLSIRHIKRDDVYLLSKLGESHPQWVKEFNLGFEITEEGLSNIADSGSEAIAFVVNYGLMGGYRKMMLGFDAPLMADFDTY